MLNEKLLILLLFRHEICQTIYTAGFSGQKFYNFNSFVDKNTKKMSENGDIYTVSKKITLTPAVTNLTSVAVVNVDDRLVTAWHNFYNSFSKLSYIYSYSCWSKLRVLAFS